MPRSLAWQTFSSRTYEIRRLLLLTETLSEEIGEGEQISQQESLLRLAVVLIVGALHSYLHDLVEDWADKLGADWQTLSALQRRYVLLQVRGHLERLVESNSEVDLWDENQQERVRKELLEILSWLNSPLSLATAPNREELPRFFRDLGASAIDRALARFRPAPGQLFFSWLKAQNNLYAGYYEQINQLILVRNEVAHGVLGRRLTLLDVRKLWAITIGLIRNAENFVKP